MERNGVFFAYRTDNFAWHARGEAMRWNIARYDGVGPNDASFANRDAARDGDVGSNPAVGANRNGFGVLLIGLDPLLIPIRVSIFVTQRMGWGNNRDVWP